jgi:hypothetical protein
MTEAVGSSKTITDLYGGIGEQRAGEGNLIASKLSGGRKRRVTGKRGKRGGQGLSEIAVPALLLTANHLYGRKTQGAPKKFGKRRFSRRRGRSFRRRR